MYAMNEADRDMHHARKDKSSEPAVRGPAGLFTAFRRGGRATASCPSVPHRCARWVSGVTDAPFACRSGASVAPAAGPAAEANTGKVTTAGSVAPSTRRHLRGKGGHATPHRSAAQLQSAGGRHVLRSAGLASPGRKSASRAEHVTGGDQSTRSRRIRTDLFVRFFGRSAMKPRDEVRRWARTEAA